MDLKELNLWLRHFAYRYRFALLLFGLTYFLYDTDTVKRNCDGKTNYIVL